QTRPPRDLMSTAPVTLRWTVDPAVCLARRKSRTRANSSAERTQPCKSGDCAFGERLQPFEANRIASCFGALEIGVRQRLGDSFGVASFETRWKKSDPRGLGGHSHCLLPEFSRSVG